ncbi:hypothetical protein DICA2_F07536 [Diutina catenulata]
MIPRTRAISGRFPHGAWVRLRSVFLGQVLVRPRALLSRPYTRLPHHHFSRALSTKQQTLPELPPEVTELVDARRYSDLVHSPHFCHDPEFVNQVIAYAVSQSPDMNLLLSESEIEVPYYQFMEGTSGRYADVDTPFYHHIYSHIPALYEWCKSLERMMFNNQRFHSYLIWLAFHMDDTAKIQRLIFSGDRYDAETIGYIAAAMIQNYDLKFAQRVLSHLVGKHRDQLDQGSAKLLAVIFSQLSEVDGLLEHFQFYFQLWRQQSLAIGPQALSTYLRQCYKFGSANEIHEAEKFIFGAAGSHPCQGTHATHYLLQSAQLQRQIKANTPHYQKPVTESQLTRFSTLAEELVASGSKPEIIDFYYNWLKFFGNYSAVAYMELVMTKMAEQDLTSSPRLVAKLDQVVVASLCKNADFLGVCAYLRGIQRRGTTPFSETLLVFFFDSFVRTYPYYVPAFSNQFSQWLEQSFQKEDHERLGSVFRTQKVASAIAPYNLDTSPFRNQPRKYDSAYWRDISWSQAPQPPKGEVRDQVSYRATKGFADVVKKGVRVDTTLITATYRRADLNTKQQIEALCRQMGVYNRMAPLLELYKTQAASANRRRQLLPQLARKVDAMSTPEQILLSRMAMNTPGTSAALTKQVLASIPVEGLSDAHKMVLLIISLRNAINHGAYSDAISILRNFDVDGVVLSPFVFQKGRHIESRLESKLNHHEVKGLPVPTELPTLLHALRGFLGDCKLRIDRDQQQLVEIVDKMLQFMTKWLDEEQ